MITTDIHDDLADGEGEFLTWKFCAPIFIANQFGTILDNLNDLIARDKSPDRRNGTLTFVEYENSTYGITCSHVVDSLREANRINAEHYRTMVEGPLPAVAQIHFFVPQEYGQVHVNSHFYDVEEDQPKTERPDIAIARIHPRLIKAIRRSAIPLNADPSEELIRESGTCGIAVGYPEQNRRNLPDHDPPKFAIPVINACAPFVLFDENQVIIHAEIERDSDVDNLSGISGGPILWSSKNEWGLAGIARRAFDIKNHAPEFGASPLIFIQGERVTRNKIMKWINDLPEAEEPIPDLSKSLYVPKNYKSSRRD